MLSIHFFGCLCRLVVPLILPCSTLDSNLFPENLHGLLPAPFLLSYSVFDFIFSLFFRFWAVR